MNCLRNRHGVDERNSKSAWRKLPKMGKRSFDGWPVREVPKRDVSLRSTSESLSIDDAYLNGHKRHARILYKDKEAHGEHGLATAARRMPSPQSEKSHPVRF